MATTYTKSLSGDFGGSFNQRQFHDEIEAEAGITPNLQGIDKTGDDIDIIFDSALSAGEQTTLNNLISSHTPAATISRNIFTINIGSGSTSSTNYISLATFEFPGSKVMANVSAMKVISNKTTGGTSYDVRIYDVTNFNEICSSNLTNTSIASNNLGTISNLPSSTAIFEIQAKVIGSTTTVIKSLNIYYD